jgi:2-keto-4-pentenoate hydratase
VQKPFLENDALCTKQLFKVIITHCDPNKVKTLESIATDFYNSFYQKEWHGDKTSVLNLSIEDAYQVQDLVTKKRINSGEQVVGFKVGCTSSSIRKQFGLEEPISGRLFYPHVRNSEISIDWSDYIQCAIEPEMVLKIKTTLRDKNPSDEQLKNAIDYVSPGIEIHEYNFWVEPPTIQELICSGGIHTGLVVGKQKVSPKELTFKDELFSAYKDKSLITSAAGSEIMGGPLHSLRWLVNFLLDKGLVLEKGSLVIPGSPVELVNIDQDTKVEVVIDGVGNVTAIFEEN